MPFLIAPLLGGTLIANLLATVASFAISYGISYYQRKQAQKAGRSTSQGQQQNYRQSTTPTYYPIGLARVQGLLSEYEAVGEKAYVCAILGDDQIESIVSFYIKNVEVLTSNSSGILTVTTPPFKTASSSLVRLEVRTGAINQLASSILTSALPTIYQAKDRGKGIAYIVAEFQQTASDKFFSTYGGSVPEVGALVHGVYVFDPRVAGARIRDQRTWVFSTNPPLHVYRYVYAANGMGLNPSIINENSIRTVANWCDEDVTTKTKGVRPRYEIGGIIRSDESPKDVLTKILDTFDGEFYIDGGGQLSLTCSDLDLPTVVITDDMIIDIKLEPTVGALYDTTSVKSRFSSEDHGYFEAIEEADQWDDKNALAQVGRSIPLEHDFPMVFRHDQARVLMKKKWAEANPKWKGEITIDFNGVELLGERLFTLVHKALGLNLTMKIESLELAPRLESVVCRCISVDLSKRGFDYQTEEGVAPKVAAEVVDNDAPSTPTGITAVVFGTTAHMFWSFPRATHVNEAQYKLASSGTWITVSPAPANATTVLTGLTPAETYDFRVRAVSTEYGASPFGTYTFTVADTVGTAGALTALSAAGGVLVVNGSVTQSASLVSVSVQIEVSVGGPSWSSPLVLALGPSRANSFSFPVPVHGTYDVHARSVAADGTFGAVTTITPVTVLENVSSGGGSGGGSGYIPDDPGGGDSSGHPLYGGGDGGHPLYGGGNGTPEGNGDSGGGGGIY